jgi:phage-related holin
MPAATIWTIVIRRCAQAAQKFFLLVMHDIMIDRLIALLQPSGGSDDTKIFYYLISEAMAIAVSTFRYGYAGANGSKL